MRVAVGWTEAVFRKIPVLSSHLRHFGRHFHGSYAPSYRRSDDGAYITTGRSAIGERTPPFWDVITQSFRQLCSTTPRCNGTSFYLGYGSHRHCGPFLSNHLLVQPQQLIPWPNTKRHLCQNIPHLPVMFFLSPSRLSVLETKTVLTWYALWTPMTPDLLDLFSHFQRLSVAFGIWEIKHSNIAYTKRNTKYIIIYLAICCHLRHEIVLYGYDVKVGHSTHDERWSSSSIACRVHRLHVYDQQ